MMTHFRTTRIAAMLMVWMAVSAYAPQSVAIEPMAGPALWQVSDDDTRIYLFGLPNLMDADTQWRNAAFDAALSEADVVILEADRSSPQAQAAMQQAAQQFGVFRDGRTLNDVLDDEMSAQVRTVAASLGVPLQALNPLKPWLAANQLQSVAVQKAGLANPQTPGAVIAAEAAEAGKPIAYFEEPTTLLAAIGGLPDDSQVRLFQQVLDIIENDPGQARRVLSQWAAGDVDGLAASFHGEGEWADETVRSALLLERNAAWQARLEEILTTETGVYFAAVGVGHVVGEASIVAALEAAGYELKRR
jgi:hypothetical protein